MKLHIQTITKKKFEVDVEDSTTILEVKNKLADEFDVSSMRLCFNGAIMEDSKTVKDLDLTEQTVLVVMGKKKTIPKPQAPAPAPAPAQQPPTTVETKETPPAPAPAQSSPPSAPAAAAPVPTPAQAPAPAPAAAGPAPVPESNTYGVDEGPIEELVAMGFEDRAQVALALRAAYMDRERAVEYILTGIPPMRMRELTEESGPARPHAPSQGPAAPASVVPTPAGGGGGGSELRNALWAIPQFEQIRSVFQTNTESMPVVMEQMAQMYPQVFHLIEQNPEEFLEIMQQTEGQPATQGAGGMSIPIEGFTEADAAAVQQLVAIGGGMWTEEAATIVLLAAERNMEVAASILFEHGGVPQELMNALMQQMSGAVADEDEEGDEEDDE